MKFFFLSFFFYPDKSPIHDTIYAFTRHYNYTRVSFCSLSRTRTRTMYTLRYKYIYVHYHVPEVRLYYRLKRLYTLETDSTKASIVPFFFFLFHFSILFAGKYTERQELHVFTFIFVFFFHSMLLRSLYKNRCISRNNNKR